MFIPFSVYIFLENKLFSFSDEAIKEFLDIYGSKYGEGAKRYAEKTFYKWQHRFINLSGATRDRLLQVVPRLLSTEERFGLFEKIIEYNEAKQKQSNCSWRYSVNEWKTNRKRIELILRNTTISYLDSLDYDQKYDLTQIEWVADKDVDTFKKVLEAQKKQAILNKLSMLGTELDIFESKWDKIDGNDSMGKEVEIKFQYSIPTYNFSICIYNKTYHDTQITKAGVAVVFFSFVGDLCVALVFFLVLMLLKWVFE